jgi:two-component system CheB/CheR fusion protein
MVIQRAIREAKPQSLSDVTMMDGNTMRKVRIEVEPARWTNQTEGLLLVSFQGTGPLQSGAEVNKEIQVAESDVIRQLEQELDSTREDLQCSIEELESSNEELKASNEEVMSMNEELQSANEELETSKEELQSLNEELSTVNSQLQDKLQDLESTNNDVANLLNCTDIATIFLDSSLRIKRFTPASTQMFKLIPTDVGRPLSDVVRCFDDDRLISDAQRLLEDLSPREREVRCDADRWYLRRVLPYRTLDNRIEGVVITFMDITERKRSADATMRRLASIVENSADAIFSIDPRWTILTWNRGAERVYGYRADEVLGRSLRVLIPETKVDEWTEVMSRVARRDDAVHLETVRVHKDGSVFPAAITASPILDEKGWLDSVSLVVRDISERKMAEQELHDREERLRAILDTAVDSIVSIDRLGIIQTVNPAVERMFGYTPVELIGQNVRILMPSPHRDNHDEYLRRFADTGEAHIIGVRREVEGRRKDGTTFPIELSVNVIDDLGLYAGILHDLSGRKQLEKQIIEIASLQQTRIGQELHDRAGQELTALSLLAGSLENGGRAKNPDYDVILRRIKEGITRLHHLIRNIAYGLVTNDITAEELERTLADLARRIQESYGITCTSHFAIDARRLTDFEANHLACIAIEACNNVCRHADAQSLEVALQEIDGQICLRITDDGGGVKLDPAKIEEGLGVGIMRQRASLIQADFRIEPSIPHGTSVVCTLRRDAHG